MGSPAPNAGSASVGAFGAVTVTSWILGLAFAIGAYGVHLAFGPFRVIRGTVTVDELTPASYFCYVFLPFGLLVGDVLLRARRDPSSAAGPAAAVAALAALAVVRLFARIPFSGHALLAAYYLCREAELAPRWGRLAAGALLGAQILYFKVHVWRDVATLLTGTLLGLSVWSAARRFERVRT